MDFTEQSPTILSFCTGIRGIERGLEAVFPGITVAANVEIETFIVENLLTAMESGFLAPSPIWTNLKTFNPKPFRNKIDGIIGGYPCQPFSVAGNQLGTEDPRHLFPYIYYSVEEIRPHWCYFENVPGHIKLGFREVYLLLRGLGYRVEAGIYSAEEVGAPHKRDRLFILAIMEDSPLFGNSGRYYGNQGRSERQNKIEGSGRSLGHSPSVEQWNEWESEQQGRITDRGPGPQMANPDNHGSHGPEIGQRDTEGSNGVSPGKNEFYESEGRSGERTYEELANANGYDLPGGFGDFPNQTSEDEGEMEREVWERYRNGIRSCGTELANSDFERLEEWQKQLLRHQSSPTGGGSAGKYPAGQGSFQYEWEAPRTVESSLVYTVNGYNFMEDLHRAIGNSVVKEVATLAFTDLLRKHINGSYS